MLEEVTIACPYCGEEFTVLIDSSAGNQSYYEDCAVCCQPIFFRVWVEEQGKLPCVETFREDE